MGPLGHSLAALLAVLGLPLGGAALLVRPGLRVGLGERLGRHPGAAPAGAGSGPGPVWVHGASVGEITAAFGLLDALRARGEAVVASTTSLTGRARVRAARSAVPSGLAPLDHPWIAAAALRRVRPSALVLVETELWPGWIAAAHDRGIPVVVASGRISDRSLPRYRRLRRLLAPTLRRLAAVGARSDADAARFVDLGVPAARVRVTGDLKLEPTEAGRPPDPELAAALDRVPVLVAGSTHPGEEEAALAALAAAEKAGFALGLVVAPRRPERFEAVAAQLAVCGRRVHRRTRLEGASLGPGEVLLLDSLGELGAVYGLAAVAFVGGTLAPVGGHNLLEPVQRGRPVLFGPHTGNVREAEALLRATGAGRGVEDAEDLASGVVAWLRDEQAGARVARAQQALEAHRGAAGRVLALLDEVRGSGP
ncbi:MAG: glycosyltransferase N-terminal domain-containing protein [Myxococcota bacterium]|nr:glycosyltransferase N-terminal domain-containing protein [Myxococcota bacterium]